MTQDAKSPRRGTQAHAAQIVERARREARLEWQRTETAAWTGTGRAEGVPGSGQPVSYLIAELPGAGWGLLSVAESGQISGDIFPTLEKAQAAAVESEALELSFDACYREGAKESEVEAVFYGKSVDNVIQMDKARQRAK